MRQGCAGNGRLIGMLTPVLANTFVRDLKLAVRRGKDSAKVAKVIDLLCEQKPLPPALRDHPLKGNFAGFRDCHVEPDLLLIYRIVENRLELVCLRLGTHADLFGK